MQRVTKTSGTDMATFRDLVFALMSVQLDGDTTKAARVSAAVPGQSNGLAPHREGGQALVPRRRQWRRRVARRDGVVGARSARSRDVAEARQWMKWNEAEHGGSRGNAYDSLQWQAYHGGNDAAGTGCRWRSRPGLRMATPWRPPVPCCSRDR